MTLSPIHGGAQIILRGQAETCRSLMALYDQLRALVSALTVSRAAELRNHQETGSFRTQLADALPPVRGPFIDLPFKRALCAIVDQCEDEDEVYHLCFALLRHIGSEAEMYVQAVAVDPDQRRYWRDGLGLTFDETNERPVIVPLNGSPTEPHSSDAGEPRSGHRSPG